jgi:hypothetical protein
VVVLADDDPIAATRLLRSAEQTAGGVPSETLPRDAFRAVLDLRNELGSALIAAEQLEGAGVSDRVVVTILQRGADSAEGILIRLTDSAAGIPGRLTEIA